MTKGTLHCQTETSRQYLQVQVSDLQQLEPYEQLINAMLLKPNIMADDDLKRSPRRLRGEAALVDTENGLHRNIKMSPSNRELARSRWQVPGRIVDGRWKPGLQIKMPERQKTKPFSTGPILYDKSIVYSNSSSSSGGRKDVNSFGAIGDQRFRRPGPLSAPLAYHSADPSTACRSQQSLPYDLLNNSTLEHENLEFFKKDGHSQFLAADLAHNIQSNLRIEAVTMEDHVEPPTLHDLVDDSTPDSDQYELLVADGIGLLGSPMVPYRVSPSKMQVRNRRRRSTTDLKGDKSPSPMYTVGSPAASLAYQESASLKGIITTRSLPLDCTLVSDNTIAPTWRRNGPPFVSTIKHTVSSRQEIQNGIDAPHSTLGDPDTNGHDAFQDKLDPGEFCLPCGVSAQPQRTNTITNKETVHCVQHEK